MELGDGVERDANGYAYRDGITSQVARQQVVVNEAWPQKDAKGWHARDVREQPADNHRPCRVRVELSVDGEVVLDGLATRWTTTHVYVSVADRRVPRQAVWVKAVDVRPR